MADYREDGSEESKYNVSRLTYSDVAARLLQDNFLLTALELHTELVESGREVPQLKEFFSNPGNFERPSIDVSIPIARSPSQATLDSLDLARLSEDGERGSDVAVLEFELRKARETINSLRANLTQAAEFESNSVDIGSERLIREDPIKPHEKRALNFLINEYMMQQDYKLTSITFSDENPEQDFEDWDDIGLNISRPAGLVSLYRGETNASDSKKTCHGESQTDALQSACSSIDLTKEINENIDKNSNKDDEVSFLKEQILALELEKINFQKLYDAALASLNSLSSPTSDMPSSETTLYTLQPHRKEESASAETVQPPTANDNVMENDLVPLPQTATHNYYGSSISTNSLTPDQFEMIDSDKNGGSSQKDGSNTSSFEPTSMPDDQLQHSPKLIAEHISKRKDSITTIEDTFSLNENPESDWGRGQFMENIKPTHEDSVVAGGKNEAWINSNLPNEYKAALMKYCNLPFSNENELLNDIAGTSQAITLHRLVYVVSATLPKIVPNLLLNKRDEVISLLICTIFLHPEQTQRDKLLQLLLNLKKKMEKNDRAVIISGLVLLLQWNIEVNCGLDSDLLGMCWEMLNSKSIEKRLLGAEASIALAPYISLDLVNSLLLSIAVSMCDSNDSLIRRQGLYGLMLACPSAAAIKYPQLEALMFRLVQDSDESIREMCIQTLAPILARSSLLNGVFHTDLCGHIFKRIDSSSASVGQNCDPELHIRLINSMIPVAFMYVVNSSSLKDKMPMDDLSCGDICDKRGTEAFQRIPFCNPKFLVDDCISNPCQLIDIFYSLSLEESEFTWNEREWFINYCIKTLLEFLINKVRPTDTAIIEAYTVLFETICVIFGAGFSERIVKPLIEAEISKVEQRMAKLESQKGTDAAVVSVYLGAILTSIEDQHKNIAGTIKRWSICSGMCSVPCSILGIPIVRYSKMDNDLLDVALSALWESVVHTSEQVRAFVAGLLGYLVENATLTDQVLNTRVVPAIVTLVSDSTVSVKCEAMGALGAVAGRSEMSASARDKCWLSLEGLAREEQNGTLGARAASRLTRTLLVLLQCGDASANGKVLPYLAMLCYSPVFASESATAVSELLAHLLPALQLSTQGDLSEHFVQNVLFPALRNLGHFDNLFTTEHKLAIESIIHKVALNKEHNTSSNSYSNAASPVASSPSILGTPESVGRRVTQMFQHSKPAINLQNIFKKKT